MYEKFKSILITSLGRGFSAVIDETGNLVIMYTKKKISNCLSISVDVVVQLFLFSTINLCKHQMFIYICEGYIRYNNINVLVSHGIHQHDGTFGWSY